MNSPSRAAPPEHRLKCLAGYFGEVWDGRKKFELRFDDRGYAVGDVLDLHEIAESVYGVQHYTGRRVEVRVTYLLRGPAFGLADGWVAMSIEPIWRYPASDTSFRPATPGQS